MGDPDKAQRICDELGVCLEESIYYLDGFGWNLDLAMEACRNKALPLQTLTVESSPEVSNAPSIQPILVDSRHSSNQVPNQLEEGSRNQLIESFMEAAVGTNRELAYYYLPRSNWNLELAVGRFLDKCRPTLSQMKSNPQSYLQDTPLRLGPRSQLPPLRTGSSSSDLMKVDPTEPLKEADMASSNVNVIPNFQESRSLLPRMDTWVDVVCHETKVSREEALYYLEEYNWNLGAAVEGCRSKTLPPDMEYSSPGVLASEEYAEVPPNTLEGSSQYYNNLISSFCDVVDGATREQAITHLKLCDWNVDRAIGRFIDGDPEGDMFAAIAMSLTESRGLPLSSSSMEVDPTKTERSLEEGCEENVTVAIPGMASSQMDGKAAEEDSSMGTFPDPVAIQDRIIVGPRGSLTTITITIVLANDGSGVPVQFHFRSNQTVRDIHKAIDDLTSEYDSDYYLRSESGVDYKDMHLTVFRISSGGSTTLYQMFGDP